MAEDEWLDSITDSMDMNLSKLWEIVKERGAWHAAIHGISESDIEAEHQQQIHLLKLIFRAEVQWSLFPYHKERKMGKKMSSLLETVLAQWSRVGVVSFNWQIIGLGHYVTQDRNPLFISSGPVSSVINVEISTRLL